MNVQKIINSNFTNKILTNKTLLKGLEKVSEHGTSFANVTSLLMTVGLRPLAIHLTPNVEEENKQYAMSSSIGSGIIKFAIVEAVALPLETLVKNIDNNPEKFLKKETIKRLTVNADKLANSRSYSFLTQIIKLSAGALTAIPKSIITVALIPIIMDNIFNKKKAKEESSKQTAQRLENSFDVLKNKNIFFTGGIKDSLSKQLGKIIDNKSLQNFVIKHEKNDKDIAKHMSAGTDIILTATACQQTSQSKRIKENRKRTLIYNNIISTGVTLFGGYGIDRLIKNKTEKFIERFKDVNAKDTKLLKYIEGINIIRPAIIFASIYYCILPIFSTYISERLDKNFK